MMDKTNQIFKLTAPYKNPYQGNKKRLLFVCSVGMLRSPTAAAVASSLGYNSRSCGSNLSCALIPISVNLIEWADKIIFINPSNYNESIENFKNFDYDFMIKQKSIIWEIDDKYDAFSEELNNLIIKLFDKSFVEIHKKGIE